MMNKELVSLATGLMLSAQGFAMSGAPSDAEVDNTAIGNHQQSWEFKALTQQNLLDNAVPLSQGFQVMAHNAYNSSAYSSIVHIDPNHSISITEMLDLGVRTIEMDYHWVWQTKDLPGGNALLMCHAGDDDIGCSGLERYLHEGVEEVNRWLRKNPKEVVVLYFQDDAEGNDDKLVEAVSSIDDLIYKHPAGQCSNFSDMVKTTTEEDVLKAGKQVIIMGSSCANRGPWTGYSWNSIHNWVSGGGQAILDRSEADCLADKSKQDGAHRVWEDATNLSAAFGDPGPRIDANLAAKAGRCGIGALSLDDISIGDSRLRASIWSWDVNQPDNYNNEDCAESWANGRLNDRACGDSLPFACKTTDGKKWMVSTTANANAGDNGQAACQALGSQWQFAVPTNSQQNEWLKQAKSAAGAERVWVNYSDAAEEGIWLTPQHDVDYGIGTVTLNALKPGMAYDFYMKAVANGCELQWQGGDAGSGERNAKFDCVSKGDKMVFFPDSEPYTAADGAVSIHGVIKTPVSGRWCGLEWDGSESGGERNGKFDCSDRADPLTIISRSNGTTEKVIVKSDNNCGLEWDGSMDDDNERNAKFDCEPRFDEFTLYGVELPSQYRELKVADMCVDTSSSAANGNNVFVHSCWNPASWQKWVHDASTGFIRNKANPHMCLDATHGNSDGTSVKVWACEDHINLKWDFIGDTIRPRKNHNLVLDAYGSHDGADLGLWTYHGGDHQRFSRGAF